MMWRIQRLIDAASDPFPGAWTMIADGLETIRINRAEIVPDRRIEDRVPGKIAYFAGEDQPVVVCGTGLLRASLRSLPLRTRLV